MNPETLHAKTCGNCQFCSCYHSFGGGMMIGFRCKILEETVFQIHEDEAEMLDAGALLEGLDLEEYGHYLRWGTDLKALMPHLFSGYEGDPVREAIWRQILNQQECFVSEDDLQNFIDEYEGWVKDQREKVHRESEELTRLTYWLELVRARVYWLARAEAEATEQ